MKQALDFFKEYLSLFLIFPTVIGGLYQIVNIIYYVGFPYVRFFSVAQVIPDGILVGIFLIYFVFVISIFTEMIKFFNWNVDNIGGVRTKVFYIIILSFALILLTFKFLESNPESIITYIFYDFLFLNLMVLVVYIITLLVINISIDNSYKILDFIYWIFLISYIISISFLLENKIKDLNDKIIKDEKFYNSHILLEKLVKKSGTSNISLLYANRDYLFFSINKNGITQILVEDAKKLTSLDDEKKDED
ncbi:MULTISPECIES: hypothetical protein [Acinetobacter]|uniref:hypothetical protein n=1 Tax=Acinetobacter TaxID=469 RepID=UPI0002CFDD98|nr:MULTISPECIES: hypothetical protein [Acinetobacter]ENW10643.1 hypothetical protein F928_02434 [Acinetobacter pittii ATCC 19004 = CIP 70.29]MCG9505146.1 hypothetical protein [Acinetobacter pittii]MCH2020811.1 hypothetical protein [Acinetobacter pittii]MCK0869007.1 hypothetical protein [Acinetobacter pittii]MDA3494134.1 hypothetical protein [Acinetobacter sp. AOR33_HL]